MAADRIPAVVRQRQGSAPWAWLWRYPWMVVAAPVIIFAKGLLGLALYAPGDGAQLFIPWFLVSARSWSSGHLPTWNPWAQAGGPLLGSSQTGALYLPNLLFVVAPAVIANNLTIAITFVVAGLGAWLLARRLTHDGVAAAVGGLGFGISTFFFAHIGHQSLIAGAAWLPWMLYGYELVRERFTPARLLVPAVAVAMAVLAGHSQMLLTDLLLFAVYLVAGELLSGSKLAAGSKRALRNASLALAAVAAGLALGAVQLLPTLLLAVHSVRQTLSYADAMSFSMPKNQLPMLLFPYLFGKANPGGPYASTYGAMWNLTELSAYPGMVLLVLGAAGALVLRAERSARAIVVMGGFALLMALGPATPLSHLVFRVPAYGQFRAWGRYLVGLELMVAVLAAYGTAILRRGASRQRRALILAAAAAAAVGVAALVLPRLESVRRHIPGGHPAPASLLVPCAFALGGVVCALALLGSGRIGPVVVVVAVVADSFFSFAAFYEWRETGPSPTTYTSWISPSKQFGWGPIASEPGGISRYLYIGPSTAPIGTDFVDVTDARGMRSVNANNVLMSHDYSQATGVDESGGDGYTTQLWGPTSHILDLLRVTTVLLNPPFAFGGPGPGSLLANGLNVGGGLLRYTYVPKLPDAFLVGTSTKMNFSEELPAIDGSSAFDPSSVALVDQPCPSCPHGPPGPAGTAGNVAWGINSASVQVTATRPAMLVLSQAWSPGWEAQVGNRTVPVVRVDGLVQGVPVPAGTSRIELSYHAPGLRTGFFVTLAAVAAFAALMATWHVRKHRASGPHEVENSRPVTT